MTESDKFPPTLGALKQHVLRANIQTRVWGQADIAHQVFLDQLQNGFYKDKVGQLKPITTESLPAAEAVIQMVKCRRKQTVLQTNVRADQRNYPALIYVIATLTVRMMKVFIVHHICQ